MFYYFMITYLINKEPPVAFKSAVTWQDIDLVR